MQNNVLCRDPEHWSILLSGSLGFLAEVLPSPAWRCWGSNQGPFACKGGALPLSYSPYLRPCTDWEWKYKGSRGESQDRWWGWEIQYEQTGGRICVCSPSSLMWFPLNKELVERQLRNWKEALPWERIKNSPYDYKRKTLKGLVWCWSPTFWWRGEGHMFPGSVVSSECENVDCSLLRAEISLSPVFVLILLCKPP